MSSAGSPAGFEREPFDGRRGCEIVTRREPDVDHHRFLPTTRLRVSDFIRVRLARARYVCRRVHSAFKW
jgi:hypothetical protein